MTAFEKFLSEKKVQVVCTTHLQQSHESFVTWSWTYSLECEDLWEFSQSQKPSFPSVEEMDLGVAEILMQGKSCTVVQHSDEDQLYIR